MSKIKEIELVIEARAPHWVGDGFRVHNFIPASKAMSMERMDPFLLLDYNSKYYFPPAQTPRGVGVHQFKR